MKVFTIENETNNITVHATVQAAEAVANAERFRSEAGLEKLAADWPMARLVETWNSLPGVTTVTKFKDRATGVSRIWKAIQELGVTESKVAAESNELIAEVALPVGTAELGDRDAEELNEALAATERATATDVAPQTPDVTPEAASAKKKATRAKKTPTDATGAPREGSKTSQVIAMLKREGGTTLDEIIAAMGWQKHTTRAMLSAGGSLTKKHGLVIVSEKIGDQRRYSIKA